MSRTIRSVFAILLVDADPSADISNTRRIRYVIKDGRIVRASAEAGR